MAKNLFVAIISTPQVLWQHPGSGGTGTPLGAGLKKQRVQDSFTLGCGGWVVRNGNEGFDAA